MKSTQKFLCYSLALVGAALMFSVGCKKADNVTNTTVIASQKPSLNYDGLTATTGATSSTLVASHALASIGSSSVTVVGFNYTASSISYTGSVTPTYTGSVTAVVPTGTLGTGAFTASLYTSAAAAALSNTLANGAVVWIFSSFATNSAGTTDSGLTKTVSTVN